MKHPPGDAEPGTAAHVLLALAAAAFVPVVFMGVLSDIDGEWTIAMLALPHAVGLVVTAVALATVRRAPRKAGVTALVAGGVALGWSLFLGIFVWQAVLLFWIGPALLIAAGVVLLRRNPKGQESPLPSMPPKHAR